MLCTYLIQGTVSKDARIHYEYDIKIECSIKGISGIVYFDIKIKILHDDHDINYMSPPPPCIYISYNTMQISGLLYVPKTKHGNAIEAASFLA